MALLPSKSIMGIVASAVVWGMFSPWASAQYRSPAPQTGSQPRPSTISTAPAPAPPSGYVPAQGYGGYYPGYGPVEYKGPYGGYLSGGADVINAQANFMRTEQESALMKQQVKQAKIDTRRKTFDNWMYEREMTPSPEEERERMRQREVERSRNNPPLTEIWSGKALNDLLINLQKMPGVPGPMVPLDPQILRHVNVTSGASHSGVGLLKDAGQLQWPVALQGKAYESQCRSIEQLLPQAIKQAELGPVSAKFITP